MSYVSMLALTGLYTQLLSSFVSGEVNNHLTEIGAALANSFCYKRTWEYIKILLHNLRYKSKYKQRVLTVVGISDINITIR